jgi:hypothetical protein
MFSHVYLFEQRICHCSLLAPTADLPIAGIRHYRGDFHRLSYTDGIAAPLFNLAIAADGECEFNHVVSIFQGWDIPTELEKQFTESGDKLKATQHQLANAEKTVKQLADDLNAMQHKLANADEKVEALTDELNATQQEFTRLRYRIVTKAGRYVDRMPFLLGLLRWAARVAT